MLRSILVALDGSESSTKASQVALQLASQHGAHVEGLGIVNSGWIQRPEPVPIGGMAVKSVLDLSRLGTARERVDRVLQDFKAQLAQAGISSHDVRAAEGNPLQLIAREATAHDLVAIGRNSIFEHMGCGRWEREPSTLSALDHNLTLQDEFRYIGQRYRTSFWAQHQAAGRARMGAIWPKAEFRLSGRGQWKDGVSRRLRLILPAMSVQPLHMR